MLSAVEVEPPIMPNYGAIDVATTDEDWVKRPRERRKAHS